MTDTPVVPPQMKKDNWAFYVLARSDNPAEKVLKTRDLVSNLMAAMRIVGETQHIPLLTRMTGIANNAWTMLNDGEIGPAIQECQTILDQITFLVYDPRWVTTKDSFGPRLEEKVT
jgi:hypothetical protein